MSLNLSQLATGERDRPDIREDTESVLQRMISNRRENWYSESLTKRP